jgi:hypothetical protein
MGQTIQSATHMVSYAGELRRAAVHAKDAQPELAKKLDQSARTLEKSGLEKAGVNTPGVGKLLDLLV